MAQLEILPLLGYCLVAALVLQTLVFVYAWHKQRLDVVDAFWGVTFIVIALTAAVLVPEASLIGWVVVSCVVLWGSRLAWHIGRRYLRSSSQDPRYTELQRSWPSTAPMLQAYGRIFVAQAILALVISIPVIMAINSLDYTASLLYVGLVIWVIGFGIESLADRQLKNFVTDKKNAGRLMTAGLWNYSRHPNYFGELTQWWGIGIIVLGTSYGVSGLIGPIMITVLICFISGLPPAERRSAGRPGWAEYQRTTSVLIPWFKRS